MHKGNSAYEIESTETFLNLNSFYLAIFGLIFNSSIILEFNIFIKQLFWMNQCTYLAIFTFIYTYAHTQHQAVAIVTTN